MGLFKNQHDKAINDPTTTIITQHSKITGDFTIKGNLHLDGSIHGNINCENTITVGKNGNMNGEVISKSFCLSGQFEGVCHTKHMEILTGGVFKGSLYTDELVIEKGGHFLGNSYAKDVDESIDENVDEYIDENVDEYIDENSASVSSV